MGVARAERAAALGPAAALDLWLDTSRWATFVDGFARVSRRQDGWPEPGAAVVWESRPGGRGTVTEKVAELEPGGRVVMRVFDDRLTGREVATFEPEEDGCRVRIEFDYTLTQGGPLRAIADALYIRRAVRDSIRRTLQRFAVEAAEEAAVRDTYR